MGFLSWIVVGLIAGGAARMVTRSNKRGCLPTMVIGMVGALIGGFLFSAAGQKGLDDFSLWSIFVAFVGASLLLLVLGALSGRRRA
jgi:uncharacterized membrane protein YeaQ/YmgE (transglycosylase-associated protein family)